KGQTCGDRGHDTVRTCATVGRIGAPRRRGTMALKREHAALSSDLDDPSAVPYFLWDEPMTVAELRARLRTASPRKGRASWGRSFREVLEAFFRKEQRFFLSGGAALVGFHLGH